MAFLTSAMGVGNTTGSPIDTTGANLLVAFVSYDGSQTFSDSKSNTWTSLTERQESTTKIRAFYCLNPSNVGTNHTFSSTVSYSRVVVMAFDGVSAYQSENFTTSGTFTVTSIACGSITPSGDNWLLVAGSPLANSISSISIDSSYTVAQASGGTSGVSYGGCGAYQIQTTATTRNPTWSWSGGSARTLGYHVAFSTTGGGGVSVNLTGQAITSARGTLTPALAVPITGQSVSFSLGTLSPSVAQSVTLTGLSFSASQGTLVPATSVPLAGNSFTASFGNLSTGNDVLVALAGLSITASRGTLTPSSAIPLTGRSATFSRGTLVPVASGPVTVNLTGLSIISAKGTIGTSAGNIPRRLTFTFANRNITINKKNLKITGSFSTKKSKFTFEGN